MWPSLSSSKDTLKKQATEGNIAKRVEVEHSFLCYTLVTLGIPDWKSTQELGMEKYT